MEIKFVNEQLLHISKCDGMFYVEIDGVLIPGVVDYEVKTSAYGKAEVLLRLELDGSITELDLTATEKERTQLPPTATSGEQERRQI